QLDKTVRLESVEQEDYDTVFYPGGHGPMWDLAEDPNSVKLIEAFLAAGKPVALVCHAPGVLRHVESVEQEDYDTVFYPGGHGPMWDLAEDPNSVKLIEAFLAAGKPVALVCHAPGVLRHVKTTAGKPLVDGKNVTGFTNGEEADMGLTKVVPF